MFVEALVVKVIGDVDGHGEVHFPLDEDGVPGVDKAVSFFLATNCHGVALGGAAWLAIW